MTVDPAYWIDLYDQIGARYDTAQPIAVLRKETEDAVKAAIENGDIPTPHLDLDEWAADQFTRHVMPERDKRANRIRKDLDYLLDGFREDGTYLDPLLAQAHRIGDRTDKVLRLWTPADWHQSIYGRLSEATKVSAAAEEYRAKGERLIATMEAAGVDLTGDLYPRDHA